MDHYRTKNGVEQNMTFFPVNPTTGVSHPSLRPNTLAFNGPRLNHSLLLTPSDHNKLHLSTPELDALARGYTTPEIINALTTTPTADERPSPGVKLIEDLINVHHSRPVTSINHPFVHNLSTNISENDREMQEPSVTYSYHPSVPVNSKRNRSISSSFHDNESSNSTSISSPVSSNPVTDELQNVPSHGERTADPTRKEKKRERNRQAAQKCRTRKLTRIAELQKRVNDLQGKNSDLHGLAECLKTDVLRLEKQLDDHRTQGCTLMFNIN